MKKYWKLIFLLVVVIMTLFIYKLTYNQGYHYVALGDFLTVGINSYGEKNYGYTDEVKDYLQQNGVLKSYTNDFANKSYTIDELKDDIEYNKGKIINNNAVSIRKILRESDIVTISIGINDFLSLFDNNFNYSNVKHVIGNKKLCLEKIDSMVLELDKLLVELKKYAKKDIILIGYYNPFPYLDDYKNEIDNLIEYANSKLAQICEKYHIYYLDIFGDFNSQITYFPNPGSIYPNSYGYKVISRDVIKIIEANIIN